MARIGVYVCWCGTNIAKMVDVRLVAKEIERLPNVVICRDYKYMCSDPGQDLLVRDILENHLNRIVVAACSPRMHEATFRKALMKAGLNPYLLEMANIREHDAWVHTDKIEATKKAKSLIAAAINRVNYHESLESHSVKINPSTLIIGGGVSGMAAAIEIADAGKKVFLIEKKDCLGGLIADVDLTFPFLCSAQQMLSTLIQRAITHENIAIFIDAEIRDITGFVGNFEASIHQKTGQDTHVQFGNIIVATGLKPFDPSVIDEYGYGKFPDVITSVELEKKLKAGTLLTSSGNEPENILIIHCVGSRNEKYHKYCSRTCCMTALKYANQLRSMLPDANIYEAYADMRTMGKNNEELYTLTARRRVMFLMFDQKNNLPKVRMDPKSNKGEMLVEMDERLSGEKIEVPADLIILMVAMEAQSDVKEVAHSFGISLDANSFFIERHPKLDPVATTTHGVFIAGSCVSPKEIPDSITQARAAAARVLSSISQGTMMVEATTAHINAAGCSGCKTCISICPYSAITYDANKGVSVVNEILCKGCGTCVALCRSKSIDLFGYSNNQIYAQVISVLNEI
jgi:heterodisulfide reductase subunit A2